MSTAQIRAILDSEPLAYMRWNALCSIRHRLLYVPTPKVACTSLKWWFASLIGVPRTSFSDVDSAESDPELVIHDALHRFAPDVTCVDSDILAGAVCDDQMFRFAVVRNPYQRIFSAWQSKLLVQEPQQSKLYREHAFFNIAMKAAGDIALGFEGFLEHLANSDPPDYGDPHWTPQACLLRPDVVRYQCVARIEHKEPLLAALENHFGGDFLNPFEGSRANESLLPYSPQFFTKRAEELVRRLYAEDFESFGYSTTLPEGKRIVGEAELDMALRAIKLIRGRHERITQIISSHSGAGTSGAEQLSRAQDRLADLEVTISELNATCARLQDGCDWLASQCAAWQRRAEELDERVTELTNFTAEQALAIEWHVQQRDEWERVARSLDSQLHQNEK